jgi:hypothetical protein
MTVEICDYVDGHFFCVLPKGHEERHGGYNDEDCPWGPFRCVCEGDPAITSTVSMPYGWEMASINMGIDWANGEDWTAYWEPVKYRGLSRVVHMVRWAWRKLRGYRH